MNYLLVDTSVIIRRLRGAISDEIWKGVLSGRAPVISPVTAHELRRGIRPGSEWETHLNDYPAPICAAPSSELWTEAADLIRNQFWGVRKGQRLSQLTNDALIVVSARRLNAQLWALDTDFQLLCTAAHVNLISIER